MLVQVSDNKGKMYWINPLYVRMLKEKGKDRTEVIGVQSTWGTALIVDEPMDSLAERISVAMPVSEAVTSLLATQDDEQQMATTAVTVGVVT